MSGSASENQKALDSLDEIIRLCDVIQQEQERLRRQTESQLFIFNLCLKFSKLFFDESPSSKPLLPMVLTAYRLYNTVYTLSPVRPSRNFQPGPKLLLMTNIKSHMRFRLVPKLMTLDDLELLYYQQLKCRPVTLVSRNIRCMVIFGDLSGCFFENVRRYYRYYMVICYPCWPVIDCKMNDLEWPWAAISR